MSNNLRKLVPQLSVPVIREWINIAYKEIIGKTDWVFLHDTTTERLYEQVSNSSSESCSVTQGSATVTGSGTTWSTGDIAAGWGFRIGSDSQPYIVSSVGSNTSITLETTYAQDSASGEDFNAQKTVYSPTVANVGDIEAILYQSPLKERSQAYLNRIDPKRNTTGAPQCFSVFSKSAGDGTVSFEIWPIPDSDYTVTIHYRKYVADLSANTDTPVFRPEILFLKALEYCYGIVYAQTQNPAFIGLKRDAGASYRAELREMIIEDLDNSSLPGRVRDVMGGHIWDNNFWTQHDVD